MRKLGMMLVVSIVGSMLASCVVRTRPCHTDCFWRRGVKVCERRCR